MAEFGFSLSSEQLAPQEMINLSKKAEQIDFDFLMMSDHFHPWVDAQGQSPFIWSVLGGASQVTSTIPIATGVTATIMRIHPVILAQATATTAAMMEGRFRFGVGSGENLNEHIIGEGWPPVQVRHSMFRESIEIIRELWKGENTNYYGEHYTVEDARIYSLPQNPPPIIVSAFGPQAAKIAGEMGDALVTTSPNEEVIKAFKDNGGKGKPMYIQFTVCFGDDEEKCAELAVKQWPIAGFKGPVNTEFRRPKDFEAAAAMVTKDTIKESMPCGPNIKKYKESIEKALDLGFTHIYLNQVGHEQEKFMRFYKEKLIPLF